MRLQPRLAPATDFGPRTSDLPPKVPGNEEGRDDIAALFFVRYACGVVLVMTLKSSRCEPSAGTSTSISSPLAKSPIKIFSESGSSMSVWVARGGGRAPGGAAGPGGTGGA